MAMTFKFTVDKQHLESPDPILSGAQIKALAHLDPSLGLFLEGHGNEADQPVTDTAQVDLSKPGRERFYTMPAATFGAASA